MALRISVQVTVTAVTSWRKDDALMAGDMSREPESAVLVRYAEEHREKVEDGTWKCGLLPFVHTVALPIDEDTLVASAVEAFVAEACPFDYLKPEEVEYEIQ